MFCHFFTFLICYLVQYTTEKQPLQQKILEKKRSQYRVELVKKIEKFENITHVHIEMPVTEHICPICGEKTKYIHDYRCRTIKDLPAFDKGVILCYRQRRYCCHNCGKRFAEQNSFVPKYYQLTRRLINKILDKTSCKEYMEC